MVVIFACSFAVEYVVELFEKWLGVNSASDKSSSNFKPTGPAKTSSGCGGTSYSDGQLNHDFKRTAMKIPGFPHDRADDKLVCKRCGSETTGFWHDLAIQTLIDEVNSPEYETMRILEDKEYRDRLRKRYKFDK